MTDIEAEVKRQRLQRRIRIAGVCQLRLQQALHLIVLTQFSANLIIDAIEIAEILLITSFHKMGISTKFLNSGLDFTVLIDVILIRMAKP